MKVAVLTGGPSLERGISLNSARSVMDHLAGEKIEIIPIYFDHLKKAYKISRAQLYSNNPSDFDFKLHKQALSKKDLIKLLQGVDIVFPAMHGAFGEDGTIQAFLEKNKIPFIGSGSSACKKAFDKYKANKAIKQQGFYTLPSALLKIYSKDNEKVIKDFFKEHKLKRAVVKPVTGGSSIGTFSVANPKEALEKANLIFSKRIDTQVVLEPFAEGREFTVIILENKFGLPVAIMPTEIEMTYTEGKIFDFRKKYLPTNQVTYHCPPRWDGETINKIRSQAKQIFSLFGMHDFARFDGWVLDNGEIWFSDFNTISGMEQNSFLFQQASRLGMSHKDLLTFIAKNSCLRQKINFPNIPTISRSSKKPVSVLFGGSTSERQTSLMSGTNAWLKLRRSKTYEPKPFLLDFDNNVWELPYALVLNHTVEEIIANATSAEKVEKKNLELINFAKTELMLSEGEANEPFFIPKKMSFNEFIKKSKYVFLGLHGGDGENGNFQRAFSKAKVKFNGSGYNTSRLCMDKYNTGEFIRKLNIKGITTAKQKVMKVKDLKDQSLKTLWISLVKELNSRSLIIKPLADGCSTGIAHLAGVADLDKYLKHLNTCSAIPANTLSKHDSSIEMPSQTPEEVLFESFVETDRVRVVGAKLKHKIKSGFVEVTVGVLEKDGKLHAFNPSITVAEGAVLSLEEKFQGGTGVNLTPPPVEIVSKKALIKAKGLIEKLANEIGIKDYARIDAFLNTKKGDLIIIEVNTLPGLTPSTVLYHQALAEHPQIFPHELLEKIIKNSGY